jgi:hypothetical protein
VIFDFFNGMPVRGRQKDPSVTRIGSEFGPLEPSLPATKGILRRLDQPQPDPGAAPAAMVGEHWAHPVR